MITVHVEVLPHLHRTLTQIRKLGALPGVAINPSTPVAAVREVAAELNHLLVMSVNPGFGGQTFIPRSYEKVREARAMFKLAGSHVAIEVDGGVDPQNAGALAEAGTTIFVAGAAIFATPDRASALQALRRAAQAAHRRAGRGLPHQTPRPLRPNRPDGRCLLSPQISLVRGRAGRPAARPRLDLP
jgi:ribulose-phosphate 3-epimerase